jgi:malate dehydrogenase (oxaloacetate-decarboxylating)
MDLTTTSWQERYRATGVYTLVCKLKDAPGMLGTLTSAIGGAGTHVGDIRVVGVESDSKIREVTVYCPGKEVVEALVKKLNGIDGVEVLTVRDEILEMHKRGVISVQSRVPITSVNDLRMVYTPGVASVCKEIQARPESSWEWTGLCDRVAIVTNGTAVLGLGDIGVAPSMPVMEGKAAIFAEFAGISAFPILVESKDVKEVVETVCKIAKSFGAIQMEDIGAPACFAIEDQLKERLDIPVCHDDQHGTATVLLAALINALKMTNRKPQDASALILGAGAAGYAIARILKNFGLKDIVVYDSVGPIYRGRTKSMNEYKERLAEMTNKQNQQCPLAEGFKGKDIFIGVARPNMVTKEMVASMAKNPLVFPLSNPIGEITVQEAYEAGAAIAADGRTINNALAYPGLFRGALDARAKAITIEMQLAASNTLAELAPSGAMLPNMLDRSNHQKVARAVAGAWKAK